MDKERIQNAVREILIAVGEDPDREGLLETPSHTSQKSCGQHLASRAAFAMQHGLSMMSSI